MERTHAARLDPDAPDRLRLPEPVSLAVADVSFISLTRLLRGMMAGMTPDGEILPMVKPQFELSPREVPRGVVRDPALRAAAVERVAEHARSLGLQVAGLGGVAARRALGQPRVLPAPAHAGGRVKRIGFAYNPTNEAALELRERAMGWCAVRGVDAWARAAGDHAEVVEQLPDARTCSSCWAATAPSCARRGP